MGSFVQSYSHADGQIGVLVEFQAADDATLKCEEFRKFAMDTALHVAAFDPIAVSADQLAEVIPLHATTNDSGSSRSAVLMEQPFVKDQSRLFKNVHAEIEEKLKVRIHIRRFARFGSDA